MHQGLTGKEGEGKGRGGGGGADYSTGLILIEGVSDTFKRRGEVEWTGWQTAESEEEEEDDVLLSLSWGGSSATLWRRSGPGWRQPGPASLASWSAGPASPPASGDNKDKYGLFCQVPVIISYSTEIQSSLVLTSDVVLYIHLMTILFLTLLILSPGFLLAHCKHTLNFSHIPWSKFL